MVDTLADTEVVNIVALASVEEVVL
jgi:hypothetical protein